MIMNDTVSNGFSANGITYIGSRLLYNDVCVGIFNDMVEEATVTSFLSPDTIEGERVDVFITKTNFITCEAKTGKYLLFSKMTNVQRIVCIKHRNMFGIVTNDNGRLVLHGFIAKCSTQAHDMERFCIQVFNSLKI